MYAGEVGLFNIDPEAVGNIVDIYEHERALEAGDVANPEGGA
ncbi:MAG: hypothetical protein AAFU79_21305 [Myxococcota bacterium]